MASEDPFLKELWQRQVEEERGELSQEEKDFELFAEIQAKAKKNKNLKDDFDDLRKRILRYHSSIVQLDRARRESLDIKDIENADDSRKSAHDALISQLDLLSREFAKAGLDNRWRDKIGTHRTDVVQWAYNVGEALHKSKKIAE